MAQNGWQRRITRAEKLGGQYTYAAEILRFYSAIARFQEKLAAEIKEVTAGTESVSFMEPLPPKMTDRFAEFLAVVQQTGSEVLRKAARDLQNGGVSCQVESLTAFWRQEEATAPDRDSSDFFARAFLQPYAVSLREASGFRWTGPTPFVCPFCKRKPGVGVLRPLGEGGQRSLICSFCLAEWEFRRIVCPGCGEEDHARLPVYTAEDFEHVRVEACDSCQMYIKTVDMTKSGLAEPVVDEIASIPLDIWAQESGYAKLQVNLLQL